MKYCFIPLFLSLFFSQKIFSQDTIIKTTGDSLFGKIIEINQQEIKFRKASMPDGPVYVERKENIKAVIFAGGLKESFENIQQKTTLINADEDNYSLYPPKVSNDFRIYPCGPAFKYQNNIIDVSKLESILNATNDKHIINLVLSSNKYHKVSYIGFAAIPLAIAGLAMASVSTESSNTSTPNNTPSKYEGSKPIFAVAGGFCLAAAVTCNVASIISTIRRIKLNNEAVKLYNERY